MENTENTENTKEMPTLDHNAIAQMSAEELEAYGKSYTESVEEFVRENLAQGLVPVIEDIEARCKQQEERAALLELKENGDYYDFAEKTAETMAICEGMPQLMSLGAKERYTAAYLMVKGAEALAQHKAAPVRDPKEIADEVWQNPEVMRLLYDRRAKQADTPLPVFARSAAGTATMPSAPKTLADASASARKRFKN